MTDVQSIVVAAILTGCLLFLRGARRLVRRVAATAARAALRGAAMGPARPPERERPGAGRRGTCRAGTSSTLLHARPSPEQVEHLPLLLRIRRGPLLLHRRQGSRLLLTERYRLAYCDHQGSLDPHYYMHF